MYELERLVEASRVAWNAEKRLSSKRDPFRHLEGVCILRTAQDETPTVLLLVKETYYKKALGPFAPHFFAHLTDQIQGINVVEVKTPAEAHSLPQLDD